MTDQNDDVVDEVASVGKALAARRDRTEKATPIEERYPDAPAELLDTIEYIEEQLDSIEQRLDEKEEKRKRRKQFVVDLIEKVEDVEAKVSTVERQYGVNQ